MTPSKDIARLLEIMAALRDKETGCPWDVEQDFASIAPYTIEEAYEVKDAIERNDMHDLCEELGDLLLQVVFHSRIAEEAGSFDFGDVVEAVTRKMIRRHPHVFGGSEARAAGMAKGMWERIKAEEKAERRAARGIDDGARGYLDDIALALPALTRALKLQNRAARVGFDWGAPAPILDKIEEEIGELREEMEHGDSSTITNEFGDLLFAVVNLGRHLGVDPEQALVRTNAKFVRRFHSIEKALKDQDRSLEAASLDDMEALWEEAKAQE